MVPTAEFCGTLDAEQAASLAGDHHRLMHARLDGELKERQRLVSELATLTTSRDAATDRKTKQLDHLASFQKLLQPFQKV